MCARAPVDADGLALQMQATAEQQREHRSRMCYRVLVKASLISLTYSRFKLAQLRESVQAGVDRREC